MNDEQFAFFRTLVETTGPSGYEVETQRVWRERVSDAAAEISTDALGNCVAVLNPGARPSVMLDAHIDEIGFLVKYIDENGFLYFVLSVDLTRRRSQAIVCEFSERRVR